MPDYDIAGFQRPITFPSESHRTLLRTRAVIGHVNEGDRLLLPGLRALHEAPPPRRILLRQALVDFFFFYPSWLPEGSRGLRRGEQKQSGKKFD
jgi:hypothetical protein